jgi:hypothetical protein
MHFCFDKAAFDAAFVDWVCLFGRPLFEGSAALAGQLVAENYAA